MTTCEKDIKRNKRKFNKVNKIDGSRQETKASEPPAKLIMVIDRTQGVLDLFEQVLSDEGYRLSLHFYKWQDLQEVKRVKPDLIISDHSFPNDPAAWQFLEKLKSDTQTTNIPVIVCTTNPKVVLDAERRLANLDITVLAKPFQIDELVTVVRELLN
jgi:CheY-like chemotaxis protein